MQRVKLAIVLGVVATGILIHVLSDRAEALSRGPFLERSGAPSEETCVTCHRTYPLDSGGGRVEILGLPEQYVPGTVYPVTVRVSDPHASRWGFQITAITDEETAAGFFQSTVPGVQALGPSIRLGRFYAEHTILGNYEGQTGSAQWQMFWKAPATDLGPVTFYAAGNGANDDHTDFFDYIYTTHLTIDGQTRTIRVGLSDPTPSTVVGSGEKATIRWSASEGDTGGPVSFRITLSTDGGENFPSVIAASVPGTDRSFVWSVPDALVSDQARIRVTAIDPEGGEHSATSSGNLTIRKIGLDERAGVLPAPHGVTFEEVAAADYDGDGLVDAAFARPGGVLLTRQSASGTLEDVTQSAGIVDASHVRALAWGDLDNDGRPDLAAVATGSTAIYRNLGNGQFSNVGTPTLPRLQDPQSVAWADLDRDGRLDLLVAAGDSLVALRNSGDGTFADVTVQIGLAGKAVSAIASGPLLALGGPDGTAVFRYDGARFVDVTVEAGISIDARTNGAAWVDVDSDGRLDLVAATAQGVRVYRGIGGQGIRYMDIGPSLGFASNAPSVRQVAPGDFDGDGDQDLFLVFNSGSVIVMRNNLGGGFDDVSERFTLTDRVEAAACVDLDRSGAMDLVTVGATLNSYFNPRSGGSALTVRPVVRTSEGATPRDAIGATVRVDLDGDGNWSTGQQVSTTLTSAGLPVLINVPGGLEAGVRVDFATGVGLQAQFPVGPSPVVMEQPEGFAVSAVRIAGTPEKLKLLVDGLGIPATGAQIEIDDVSLASTKAPRKRIQPDGTTTRLAGRDAALASLTSTKPVAVRVVDPATGVLSVPLLLR